MNTGRQKLFLDLEDKFDEELMEYFRIKEYSKPNQTSFKGPANRIPFKEMFYDDNFLVVTTCGWPRIEVHFQNSK